MTGQNLELRITQKMVLSQSLLQSLKILQLPVMELKEYIEEELEQNPMLELAEKTEKNEKESEAPTAEEWNEYLSRDEVNAGEYEKKEDRSYESLAGNRYSLEEHLVWQLRLSDINQEDYTLGEKLIGELNEDGYLRASADELAVRLNAPAPDIKRVIALIQALEPVGVGAFDLKECLLIQLKAKGLKDSISWKIVTDCWGEFEKGKFREIAEKLKAEQAEVGEAVRIISKLEPKPGREIESEEVRYIVPDVIIEKDENSGYRILLNNQGMPRLELNRVYQKLLKSGSPGGKEKKFLEEKLKAAIAVIKAIEERKKTLFKVTRAIVGRQSEFLEKGIEHLKPLTLKEISEEIGMHESTVSRVTANKYVQAPGGIFAFRHFFNVKLDRGEGGPISSASVKEMIKNIIGEENKRTPLSDGKIAEILQGKGISVQRRTVAKYREEVKILTAAQRGIRR
ncbi:MAG: RNA polymerase factor sigma-54 [Candidatus Firestonebacteria bacterium]